jgi:hypothetical protein
MLPRKSPPTRTLVIPSATIAPDSGDAAADDDLGLPVHHELRGQVAEDVHDAALDRADVRATVALDPALLMLRDLDRLVEIGVDPSRPVGRARDVDAMLAQRHVELGIVDDMHVGGDLQHVVEALVQHHASRGLVVGLRETLVVASPVEVVGNSRPGRADDGLRMRRLAGLGRTAEAVPRDDGRDEHRPHCG